MRVASESKGVICLPITFRHSTDARVDLLKRKCRGMVVQTD